MLLSADNHRRGPVIISVVVFIVRVYIWVKILQSCTLPDCQVCLAREYVVEHVLREAQKICIAMSVTLGTAAVQKSAEDTLIGTKLVQKML